MGVVSRMWVQSMGVAGECACKEVYIDFLILLIPTPLVSFFFAAASLLFILFLNVFRSCFRTFL